jgi:hypothetical protein
MPFCPRSPSTDATFTIEPPPAASNLSVRPLSDTETTASFSYVSPRTSTALPAARDAPSVHVATTLGIGQETSREAAASPSPAFETRSIVDTDLRCRRVPSTAVGRNSIEVSGSSEEAVR